MASASDFKTLTGNRFECKTDIEVEIAGEPQLL